MGCIFFICCSLVPTGGDVLWCRLPKAISVTAQATHQQNKASSTSVFLAHMAAFLLVANRDRWRDRLASATTDKPFSLTISLSWSWVQCVADRLTCPPSWPLQLFTRWRSHSSRNFTPYWQCGFCQLPLQHPFPSAHPFFRSLVPFLSLSHCLILILQGGSAL